MTPPKFFLFLLLQAVLINRAYCGSLDLPEDIDLAQLANSEPWLALSHYRQLSNGRWQSEITSDAFFISEAGRVSPLAELGAFLEGLSSDFDTTFCRFPARASWLQAQLNLNYYANCEEFENWKREIGSTELSIVNASPFMSSPASMFGHTFLMFGRDGQSDLLATSANFSAQVAPDIKGFSFLRGGLTGRFNGVFDFKPYSDRLRRYSLDEGRELWQYKLDLNEDDIKLILAHLWELRLAKFRYYYLDQNCSYRLLAVLAVAKPELRKPLFKFHTKIPVDTIKILDSFALISGTQYWSSIDQKIKNQSEGLTSEQVRKIRQYIEDGSFRHRIELNNQEAAFSYLLVDRDVARGVIPSDDGIELIKGLQSKIEAGQFDWYSPIDYLDVTKSNPLDSHGSQRFSLFLGELDSKKRFARFQYRFAGHDATDSQAGFGRGLSAEYLKVDIVNSAHSGIDLRSFTAVDIQSRALSKIESLNSWQLEISSRRFGNLAQSYDRVSGASYGVGKSWGGDHMLLSVIPKAYLGYAHGEAEPTVGVGFRSEFQVHFNRINLIAVHEPIFQSSADKLSASSFVVSVPLYSDYIFLAGAERSSFNDSDEVLYSLGLHWYLDRF